MCLCCVQCNIKPFFYPFLEFFSLFSFPLSSLLATLYALLLFLLLPCRCLLHFVSPQVLGNAKGAVAVVVSILLFRNPVTVFGMVGYSVTVLGVVLYGEAKKRSGR